MKPGGYERENFVGVEHRIARGTRWDNGDGSKADVRCICGWRGNAQGWWPHILEPEGGIEPTT